MKLHSRGKIFTVPFRRKREGKTHYKKRLKVLLSNKYRLVVRKSLRNLQASIIKYNAKGDKVLFTVSTMSLSKFGWKGNTGNLPSAYLVGLIAGRKAIANGIKDVILDVGLNKTVKGSRLYAALTGAIDSGLNIPFDAGILPTKDRFSGEHIVKYANMLKGDILKYNSQFSNYIKRGLNPEDIAKHFIEIKGKING